MVPRNRTTLLVLDCQSRKSLCQLLRDNPEIKEIWGTQALWDFEIDARLHTLPVFFLQAAREFDTKVFVEAETNHVFNFMINKKQDHRYLTLRLIEYFNLRDFDYTYSGSCKNIRDDLVFADLTKCDPDRKKFTPNQMMQILGDVTIPPRFLGRPNFLSLAEQTGGVGDSTDFGTSWQLGLDRIFSSSLISLITESDNGDYDRVTNLSEKSVFAILGLTIPIWPGGYRHAEMLERMGFDVFNDIVDHSYQFEDTMFMRCWRAFEDNLAVLQDLSQAKQLRKTIHSRLCSNRRLLCSSELKQWYCNQLKSWPADIKKQLHTKFSLFDPD